MHECWDVSDWLIKMRVVRVKNWLPRQRCQNQQQEAIILSPCTSRLIRVEGHCDDVADVCGGGDGGVNRQGTRGYLREQYGPITT